MHQIGATAGAGHQRRVGMPATSEVQRPQRFPKSNLFSHVQVGAFVRVLVFNVLLVVLIIQEYVA